MRQLSQQYVEVSHGAEPDLPAVAVVGPQGAFGLTLRAALFILGRR
ncbi:MAG: hypothetical protein JNM56_06700, partial [Planctomycetia bacterium]|nr:hypothetical protein [Planctomycetia bacterium]